MAPKRKGVSVNLRDLQREMGVGAAMLLPSAPKPVDEAAAERGRYGGAREGYGDRSGGGGGGVRWADRDSDDDDEWRRDDEGQTNGVGPRGQRTQAPDIPDQPWRSAPRQAPGGGEAPGRHSSGGPQQRGEAGAADDKDWGVLRSACRGGGSHGEGDNFRSGGGRDEEVDFAEVRRAAPQQQRKPQQHQSGTAAADAEDALDFGSLRSASIDRVARGGDDRPEHLRTLRSRLAERAAEKLQHQQEAGAAGGAKTAASQQSFEANVSSPLRTASSSGAPPLTATGGTAALGSRMSTVGLGHAGGDGGGGRPARYIPPSKRGTAVSAAAAPAVNARAAAFLEEEERKPHAATTRGTAVAGLLPSRQEVKEPEKASPVDAAAPAVAGGVEEATGGSAAGSGQTPTGMLKHQEKEEGEEKEEVKTKEGHASAAATPAATASPAAGTSPGAATPVKCLLPTAGGHPSLSAAAIGGSESAAAGETAAARETQKALPRWKQRLEQRRREQEAAAGGSSSAAPGGAPREKETTTTGTLLSVSAPQATDEGGEPVRASAAPVGATPSPAAVAGPAAGGSAASTGSRGHAFQQEEVIQLQPIRLGSATKRADAASGEGGKYVPPSVLRQQQKQQQHGGLSCLSAAGRGVFPSDVQRLFLQAAAAAGNRSRSHAAGGEKERQGGTSSSGQDAAAVTAEGGEEKKKEQKKKERELERERQEQEALAKEREKQEKLWKHDESQVQMFVQLLEETLAAQAVADQQQQPEQGEDKEKQQPPLEENGRLQPEKTESEVETESEKKKDEKKEQQKLVLSEEEGGIFDGDTLRGMVPCIVVAAALMKRCMQKKEMEEVREEVQRASCLWKELLRKSQVEEKDQILIREMARAVKAVKCPRLSPSVSLIEALWDAMVATEILPDTAFIKWFEDDKDESDGRKEVLFQVLDWCLWLQGDLTAPNEEEYLEDEAEDDVDIEALVPKRGGQKSLK